MVATRRTDAPWLTAAGEQQLVRRWKRQQDPAALARLVEGERWLAVRIARNLRQPDDSFEDLVQEGLGGIVDAVERFDVRRGTRLSTYAAHWIRARIVAYVLRNRRVVRLPTSPEDRKTFFALSRARRRLEASGQTPDRAALAQELGVSEARVERVATAAFARDLSIDARISSHDERLLSERLADEHASPEVQLMDAELDARASESFHSALATLSPRERAVIEARWLGNRVLPLRALGERLGVSRERVRQIEARAKRKLRARLATV